MKRVELSIARTSLRLRLPIVSGPSRNLSLNSIPQDRRTLELEPGRDSSSSRRSDRFSDPSVLWSWRVHANLCRLRFVFPYDFRFSLSHRDLLKTANR